MLDDNAVQHQHAALPHDHYSHADVTGGWLRAATSPREKPSARVAAVSSVLLFAVGAVIPLLPYIFGIELLWPGLVCGAVGLVIAGAVAARFTAASMWLSAGRQLGFGVIAIAATYLAGKLIGTVV